MHILTAYAIGFIGLELVILLFTSNNILVGIDNLDCHYGPQIKRDKCKNTELSHRTRMWDRSFLPLNSYWSTVRA